MFDVTDRAFHVLKNAVKQESSEGEKLFVRLTMGIG